MSPRAQDPSRHQAPPDLPSLPTAMRARPYWACPGLFASVMGGMLGLVAAVASNPPVGDCMETLVVVTEGTAADPPRSSASAFWYRAGEEAGSLAGEHIVCPGRVMSSEVEAEKEQQDGRKGRSARQQDLGTHDMAVALCDGTMTLKLCGSLRHKCDLILENCILFDEGWGEAPKWIGSVDQRDRVSIRVVMASRTDSAGGGG